MSNVLVIQSSISGEQSRSQCYSLAGSRGPEVDHRSPISRTGIRVGLDSQRRLSGCSICACQSCPTRRRPHLQGSLERGTGAAE